jgi:hypothetical protein
MEEEKNPYSGIVNCTYKIQDAQVHMLSEDDKAPGYIANKLAPDTA